MREAMIVWGGWEGHEPETCAHIIAGMLEEEGMKVRLETSTKAFGDPAIANLSLIVPIYTQSKIAQDEVDNLSKAIEGGVGLGGYHGGMGDAFREAVDYQFMCGGQWVCHPGDPKNDYLVDYVINITKPADPIMKDIKDFPYRSEQYYLHIDPSIEVLATTTFSGQYAPWTKGRTMPVVWKYRHGEGRVFYSSLGHASKEFEVPEMRTILKRGLMWAAR